MQFHQDYGRARCDGRIEREMENIYYFIYLLLEISKYVPSVLLAIKLANALEKNVEDLFR